MPKDTQDLFADEENEQEQTAKDFQKFHDNLVALAEKLSVDSTAIVVYEEKRNEEGVEIFGFGKTRDLVFLANVVNKVIKP